MRELFGSAWGPSVEQLKICLERKSQRKSLTECQKAKVVVFSLFLYPWAD